MGRPVVDLTNRQFGRLTVLEHIAKNGIRGSARWKVRCDCGNIKTVLSTCLVQGNTKSCGCLNQERARERAITKPLFKHGHSRSRSPEYTVWKSMLARCTNPNVKCYSRYGGNGITVCERWRGKDGFVNFFADMGERPSGTTLGRFGDVGNYEPGNVAWQTSAEQVAEQRKKRSLQPQNKKITAIYSSDALPISQLNEIQVSI